MRCFKDLFSREAESVEEKKLIRQEPAIVSVASSVLKTLVSIVETNEGASTHAGNERIDLTEGQDHAKPSTSRRRVQDVRRQYTAIFKSQIIDEMDDGEKEETFAIKYRINRSLPLKWYKDLIKIIEGSKFRTQKTLENPASKEIFATV